MDEMELRQIDALRKELGLDPPLQQTAKRKITEALNA
jgi:hypothetical protein